MTGTGSFSPSLQPVAEIPSTLSLSRERHTEPRTRAGRAKPNPALCGPPSRQSDFRETFNEIMKGEMAVRAPRLMIAAMCTAIWRQALWVIAHRRLAGALALT